MQLPRGVYASGSKYTSTVQSKGRSYYLGTFNSKEDAEQAYLEKKAELNPKITIQEKFEYIDGFIVNKLTQHKYTSINNNGYIAIHAKDKVYLAHRLAWELLKGPIPENMMIDHIDRNRSNNLISNLRLATCQQNLINSPSRHELPKGVHKLKSGKYQVRVHYNYKNYYLGTFSTLEEASEEYTQAMQILHGDFAQSI